MRFLADPLAYGEEGACGFNVEASLKGQSRLLDAGSAYGSQRDP